MNIKKVHYFSGLIISIFVGLHLCNHFYSIFGAPRHIELMTFLRLFYRNIIVETFLILAIAVQVYSGIKLFIKNIKIAKTFFEKLQIWTGLYLAFFFVIHLSAVLAGRFFLHLDTNFYFGVAGLNNFPTSLFFLPYYALAILCFFGHIAAIHHKKMKHSLWGLTPKGQSILIITFGFLFTIMVFYGLTNHFHGVKIPTKYSILIRK